MSKVRTGLFIIALMFSLQPVRADLIWRMGVTNYTAGATNFISGTLADDTFTSLSAATVYLKANEYEPGEFNLAISNGTAQAKNVRLQAGLTSEHKLVVVSMDYMSATAGAMTINALSAANTRPHGVLTVISGTNAPARFTLVVNRTGGNIELPNGQILANNTAANYIKAGSDYLGYSTSALSSDIAGFMLSPNAVIGTHYVDNIGLWATTDGSVDQWAGKSVMDLNYGTAIPEPASVGLIALGSALVLGLRKIRK